MGHYHSYEAEAKGVGTTVLDFTEEELKLDYKRPPNPQNNAGNISSRGNNDDMGNRHLHDYSLAYSEVYPKKDPHLNRTNNSIRTNLHDQKPEEVSKFANLIFISLIPLKLVLTTTRFIIQQRKSKEK